MRIAVAARLDAYGVVIYILPIKTTPAASPPAAGPGARCALDEGETAPTTTMHLAMERVQVLTGHLRSVTPAGAAAAHDDAAAAGDELTLRARSIAPDDIIMGCGPLSSRSGPREQTDAAVHAALAAGIVRFDTAPLYGDSEDTLGHALAASPLGGQARLPGLLTTQGVPGGLPAGPLGTPFVVDRLGLGPLHMEKVP